MLSGVPLALGSWWGLFAIVPITLVIVWRLLDEEQFLAKNLPGYSEYRNKVRYRLVPFIWSCLWRPAASEVLLILPDSPVQPDWNGLEQERRRTFE
jgi:hypothetical protein